MFTSLARCGENEDGRRGRLLDILHQATGLNATEGWMRHPTVWFDYPKRVQGLQRAVLEDDGDTLQLRVWLGELTPQARRLYGDRARAERLAALASEADWRLHPNPHVAFFQAPEHQRWYTTCLRSPSEYVRRWVADVDRAGRTISRNDLEGEAL